VQVSISQQLHETEEIVPVDPLIATSKDGSIPDHVESSGNIASSFLSQAASLLSKSLGTNLKKVTVPGQVKSLQLAAAAKEKVGFCRLQHTFVSRSYRNNRTEIAKQLLKRREINKEGLPRLRVNRRKTDIISNSQSLVCK